MFLICSKPNNSSYWIAAEYAETSAEAVSFTNPTQSFFILVYLCIEDEYKTSFGTLFISVG